MKQFASSDQIARAVVAASRLVGADPLSLYAPSAKCSNVNSRMRWLAHAGLSQAFPDYKHTVLARLLGIGSAHNAASNLKLMRRTNWWREAFVGDVVGAILGPEVESLDAEADPPAPAPFRYMTPEKPRRSVAVLPFCEPPPGRSALDARRPREPVAGGAVKSHGVRLPRVAFLERGV